MVDLCMCCFCFFFQAEDGIRDLTVTGVQTCALPISRVARYSALAAFGRPGTVADDARIHGAAGPSPSAGRLAGRDQMWCRFRMAGADRKSTRLNSSHSQKSHAVFCLQKKKKNEIRHL